MNGATRKGPLWRAIIGSFVIYLIPIVGPHSIWISGAMLLEEIFGSRDRELLWRILDVGLAVLLQAAFAAFLYFVVLGRSWWRWLLLAPAIPVVFFAMLFGFQLFIPMLFLVEADPSPEQGNWPRVCILNDQWLDGTGASPDLAMERAGEVWVMQAETRRYSILTMPDCRLRPVNIPVLDAGGGIGQGRPGGAALYRSYDRQTQRTDLYALSAGATAATELVPPSELPYWNPVAFGDGGLAWLDNLRQNGAVEPVLRIRAAVSEGDATIPLQKGRQYQLLGFDARSGDFLLTFYPTGMIAIGTDGAVTWGPHTAIGLAAIGANLRRVGDGWVAWDSYRDQGRYRIDWFLPSGSGSREIPKGRSITAVSVNPGGDLIAVSTSPGVSLGNIEDAVFVFRTKDGSEIFRRILPTYSRAQVQFIGDDYLAMYELEGDESRVVVLQVVR
jgi:hypothetical protein